MGTRNKQLVQVMHSSSKQHGENIMSGIKHPDKVTNSTPHLGFVFGIILILVVGMIHFCPTKNEYSLGIDWNNGTIGTNVKPLPPSSPLERDQVSAENDMLTYATENGEKNIALYRPVSYWENSLYVQGEKIEQKENYLAYCIRSGKTPNNLTDGDLSTQAFPASYSYSYIVDLGKNYDIERIRIFWGKYGTDSRYITHWKVMCFDEPSVPSKSGEYFLDPERWLIIDKGHFPGSASTTIEASAKCRFLWLFAASLNEKESRFQDWIGIYELEVFGEEI